MRAVNLIPPEDRGQRRPTRTGPLAYIVIGGLVLALLGVTLTVMTGNSINDKKAEVSSLQQRQTELQAQIAKVQSYADLAALEQSRVTTVKSLAQSRFDWSRVLRELALVIPSDVWLTNLTGTVSPEVTLTSGGAGSSDLRTQAAGPALTMDGCAKGHDAVASFLDVLRDIDGVTRVAVSSSDKSDTTGSGSGSASPSGGGCTGGDFLVSFNIVVAFDPVAAPALPPTTPSTDSSATTTSPTGSDGGVSGAQAQEQQARNSIQDQTTKAHNTVNAITPGAVGG